jgi:ParB family transcriptional regulator, chromosome partitioning protein
MSAPMNALARGVTVRLDAIEIPSTTRPYNATAVVELSRSIAAIGLQSAPTVIERGRGYLLVAGRHRIEALKLLGRETVFARLADMDDLQARMWTISENLHRAELPALHRAEQMAEFVELSRQKRAGEQSAQVAPKPPGRPQSGDRLAARELGIPRDEIRRAQAVASLPEETKAAAQDLGLDDNQAALLAAARTEEPEEQIEVLETIAARGRVSDAKPLRNLENIAAGELARWVKQTTPNDRPHVIRVLEEAAAILRDELIEGTSP